MASRVINLGIGYRDRPKPLSERYYPPEVARLERNRRKNQVHHLVYGRPLQLIDLKIHGYEVPFSEAERNRQISDYVNLRTEKFPGY